MHRSPAGARTTAQPRRALLDPALTRPDWVNAPTRPAGPLWLDKNENSDPEMARLVAAVTRDVLTTNPDALNTYPESGRLYGKLAAFAGVSPRHLLLAAGSDGVIRSVFEACVSEGDRVAHTDPTFAMYPVYCQIYGANAVTLPYTSTATGPRLAVDTILGALDSVRPRLLCLPNPDSPTGTVLTPAELEAVVERAARVGAWVLADEAYHPFYPQTAASLVDQYPNLIIARTFAKAWAMAGLRIGYAIAAPETTTYLHKVRSMYEVNTLAVAVTEQMLDHVDAMHASVARLNAGRDQFAEAMRAMGFETLTCHGNFCHVRFGAAEPAVFETLDPVVLYRRNGGGCLDGFSRLSATTPDLFAPIIARVSEAIRLHRSELGV